MAFLHTLRPPILAPWLLLVGFLPLACGTGCTSALSTAYLRDTLWDSADHAAESEAVADASEDTSEPPVSAEADADRRQAAIEEAESRLAKLGTLDEATRASLVETLHRTQQEDWPAVIEAFATSLETTASPPQPLAPAAEAAEPHVVAKAALDQAAPTAVGTAATPAAVTIAATAEAPEQSAAADTASEASTERRASDPESPAVPTPRPLAVQNACFASRVQGWGLVERFPTDRFRIGQEVIVYFELDNLSSEASPAGHTTCIDAELRLLAADGTLVKAWSFEPIVETCRLPRHDYFARYVVTIPAAAPVGDGRLELVVTDTLAGRSAEAAVPLAITATD
jgi:hypothetical protein